MITKFIQQCKPQQRNRTHNNEKIEGVLLSNDRNGYLNFLIRTFLKYYYMSG